MTQLNELPLIATENAILKSSYSKEAVPCGIRISHKLTGRCINTFILMTTI